MMASSLITSLLIQGQKVETVADFIFLGSKITADSDCSPDIKRCLLLGRKAMTNLDSTLKSWDITLPIKVRIVKAMAFPVVIQVWELDHEEGWAPNNWCFWVVVLEKTLEGPLAARRSNQSILKEIHSQYSVERLTLQYFGHLMHRANSLEKTLMLGKIEGKRRSGWQRMKCLDNISNSMDIRLGKLRDIMKHRGAWRTAVHGAAKSHTRLSNWTMTRRLKGGEPIYVYICHMHVKK